MQSQVPELLHQSPKRRIVSYQRNDTGVAALGRLDLDVIDETDQQAPALTPDDDLVLPGVARGFDHGNPDAAIRKSWHQGPEPAQIRGWLVNRWKHCPAGIGLCLANDGHCGTRFGCSRPMSCVRSC